MIRFIFLFFIISLLNLPSIRGQSDSLSSSDYSRFIIKDNEAYLFKGEVYTFDELRPLFDGNKEAIAFYKRVISKQKLIKQSNYLIGISGGIACTLFILANKQGGGTLGYFKFGNLGIGIIGVNMIVFPFNITQKLLRNKYKRKSIQKFNDMEIIKNGYNRDKSFLQLGMTNSGVGLVYQF